MSGGDVAVSVEQHRPLKVSRHGRLRNPRLPVVQVNPFMREREGTWYKEKSLPEFYEKPDVVLSSTEALIKPPPTAFSTHSESQLTTRENRPILPLSQSNKPNNEAANVSVPVSAPQSKVKLFDAVPPVDVVRGRKLVFPPSPRNECITPENPIKRLPKHGFAPTIVDREKKTTRESTIIKPTSLLNRERTQEFVTKQQLLRLRGMRLADGHLAPTPSAFLHRTDAVPVKSLEEFYRHLITSYSRGYGFSPTKSRIKVNSYDPANSSWSRQNLNSEPLVSLNSENLSTRFNNSMDMTDSKSAFRILETAGKPTHIEQNLESDYNNYYSMTRLGRSQSTGYHFTRYLKLKNYNPTQGELFIMMNKEQNRPGYQYSKGSQQLASTRMLSDEKAASWLLESEAKDIPISPESTMLAVADDENCVTEAQDGITSVPPLSNLTHVADSTDEREHDDDAESRVASDDVHSPSKLEITTTLPDINNIIQ